MKTSYREYLYHLIRYGGIVFLIICPCFSIAQDITFLKKFKTEKTNENLIAQYWNSYKLIDNTYKCDTSQGSIVRAVNDATFDSLLRPALSNIFIGSNDLTKNTTAASFTQDDKTGTLNLNYAYLHNKNIFNIGAFSKASNGIFGIYTGDSWSSDIGLTLAWSFPICLPVSNKKSICPSLYFDRPDCEKLKNTRRVKVISLLERYTDISQYNVDSLKKDSASLQEDLVLLLNSSTIPADFAKKTGQLQQIDSILKVYYAAITTIQNETNLTKRNELLKDHLDSTITEWEVKNADLFTGYNIIWVSLTAAVSNNSLSLNTDSLPPIQKKEYSAKNLAKFLVGVSISWQRNTKRYLNYINLGVNVGLHNYLDHPSVKTPGLRFDTLTSTYYVYNKNAALLGKYNDVKANIFTIEPSLNYSVFFAAGKQFGWNIRSDFRIPVDISEEIKELYPTTFNCVTGPLFRLNKDKSLSAGTVGLDVGIIDCPVKTNVWKSFGFKFKVGIPFNALIK